MWRAANKAILALQRVAMAHPASDDHSRDMFLTADGARHGLLVALAALQDSCPEHVASADDAKVCDRCGIHIDALR